MPNNSFKILILALLSVTLTGCLTKFVNKPTEDFEKYSCAIKEELCGAGADDKKLHYTVKEIAPNEYRVEGEVKFRWLSQGSRKWIEFYILFMDDEKVLHEKKIKTSGRNASFDFSVELDKKPTMTTFTDLKLWTAS